MNRRFNRVKLFESPVFTSWLSLSVQSLNTLVILPLAVSYFSQDELTVWLVLAVVMRFRDVFDFGLLVTISRHVAECRSARERLILRYFSRRIFRKINLAAALILPFVFLFSMYGVIEGMESKMEYVGCAAIVYLSSIIYLKGNYYRAYLIGVKKIHLIKINESLINSFVAISTIIFILFNFGLLTIVLIQLIGVFALFHLNKSIYLKIAPDLTKRKNKIKEYRNEVELKASAKREFLSGILGTAFVQVVNISIANIFNQTVVNNYLIIEKVIEQIKNFSRVVFYTRLPWFSKLYINNEMESLKSSIINRYRLTLIILSLTVWGGTIGYNLISNNLGYNDFKLDYNLIILFLLFALIERMTSMHNQVYLITNDHVVSHIGMLVTISLFTIFYFVATPLLGIYSVPFSFAVSYFTFYYFYVSKNTMRKLNENYFRFEFVSIVIFLLNVFILILIN